MSEPLLSQNAAELLVRLRREGAVRGKPLRAWAKGAANWQDGAAAGRLLIQLDYARSIPNSDAPGSLFLELKPAGIDRADRLIAERRFGARLARFNWLGWLTFVLALVSAVAAVASAYFAYTGPQK